MTAQPLHRLHVSDFRRLDGHREYPLDAPVVLIHGPNGSGKTSILSALEMSLTGEIRSLRRHDERYTAHLPFYGQPFATLHAEVSAEFTGTATPSRLTVGGSRIEGTPALNSTAGQFFAERCYLDQVSLGRLLELYQYREGKEESALARFVNELLGLEQLDALRLGLSDAGDIRRLKKLSDSLARAQVQADTAADDLGRTTGKLEQARQDQRDHGAALTGALNSLQLTLPQGNDTDLSQVASDLLAPVGGREELDAMRALTQQITALGGRIEGLSQRPSTTRVNEAKALVAATANALTQWAEQHEAAVAAWTSSASAQGLAVDDNLATALSVELDRVVGAIERQRWVTGERARLEAERKVQQAALAQIESELADLRELAGSLAEALSELQSHVVEGICPVCDRDFSDISSKSLGEHIDEKIANITAQGSQLRSLRTLRDAAIADLERVESTLQALLAETWSEETAFNELARQRSLQKLKAEYQELAPRVQQRSDLRSRARQAERESEDAEALSRDVAMVEQELQRMAKLVGGAARSDVSMEEAWTELRELARHRLDRLESDHRIREEALAILERLRQSSHLLGQLTEQVAGASEHKQLWDARVAEARRRQLLAKAVQEASSKARAAIVQRVFTESLNQVWRDVFTRLAPREPFVPSFGIPTASKTALELTLQTVHASGELGGSPQTMLSAGNLNTAALSLFLALHLAVEPLVPCLVFDDPVQSMDEVHIAQFAGLIRILAKSHGRQVVIAVHERELFEYLRLELSPAYDGDELITIELGSRADDEDRGITRMGWTPDAAVAS